MGKIEAIDTVPDGRGHQSICMHIGDRDIALCAGEIYEDLDGSLTIHQRDENVLVFVDADAYRRTVFGQRIVLT